MASTPAELKIHEAMKRALQTPPKQFERVDGTQVVRVGESPAFEVARSTGGMVTVRQLQEGPFTQETIWHLRSVLGIAVRPAVSFNGWDGKMETAILQVLPTSPDDGMRIKELMRALWVPRPQLMTHLTGLLDAGTVEYRTLQERGAPKVYWNVGRET